MKGAVAVLALQLGAHSFATDAAQQLPPLALYPRDVVRRLHPGVRPETAGLYKPRDEHTGCKNWWRRPLGTKRDAPLTQAG